MNTFDGHHIPHLSSVSYRKKVNVTESLCWLLAPLLDHQNMFEGKGNVHSIISMEGLYVHINNYTCTVSLYMHKHSKHVVTCNHIVSMLLHVII